MFFPFLQYFKFFDMVCNVMKMLKDYIIFKSNNNNYGHFNLCCIRIHFNFALYKLLDNNLHYYNQKRDNTQGPQGASKRWQNILFVT